MFNKNEFIVCKKNSLHQKKFEIHSNFEIYLKKALKKFQ